MSDILDKLTEFVENGGRFRANEEPRYGEPFYGDYMKQHLEAHYKPGDRIRIVTDSQAYEGILLNIGYRLELLISGKKVHKDKRNKKEIRYDLISTIELIKSCDGFFDLQSVYPDEWERQNRKDDIPLFNDEKTENRRKTRNNDREAFHRVYPDVDFDKSHVIQINDGCSLYWPFNHNGISAEIFMVRGYDNIINIPCKTGTPFPNKNSFHAYNCQMKDRYPDLFIYLPDNGFRYQDVNIVCVWSINTTISDKDVVLKVVSIYHIDNIKPIEDEHNLIFLDMNVAPLLGYGEDLFTDHRNASLLTRMMDRDMYFVLNLQDDLAGMVKTPEMQSEEEMGKYSYMSVMGINGYDLQELLVHLTDGSDLFPVVETFCDIEKEPERYYSSAWRHCKAEYKFRTLK